MAGFLINDHSIALARAVVEMSNLRPEERTEAFGMCYAAAKAAFESYEEKTERMQRRVKPSKN